MTPEEYKDHINEVARECAMSFVEDLDETLSYAEVKDNLVEVFLVALYARDTDEMEEAARQFVDERKEFIMRKSEESDKWICEADLDDLEVQVTFC